MDQPKQPSPLKPVDTTAIIIAALGLLKEVGAIFALAMMEWARIKQHKAEDKTAVAETELKVLKAQVAVEKANAGKDPRDVIGAFLDNSGPK